MESQIGNKLEEQPLIQEEESSSFNIVEWLIRFLRHWYLLVGGLLLGFGYAYVKNRSWQPQYVTQAKVIIEDNSASQYTFMQGFGASAGMRNMNNQFQVLGSYDLIRRTVEKLPFGVDYYSRGRFKTNNLYGYQPVLIEPTYIAPDTYGKEFKFVGIDASTFNIVLGGDGSDPIVMEGRYNESMENQYMFIKVTPLTHQYNRTFYFSFRSLTSLEDEFASRLSLAAVDQQSSVVNMSLVGSVVRRDIDFLDALATEFLASNLEKKNAEAIRTIDFINEQLQFIADSLNISEGRLRDFRRANNIVDVSTYAGTLTSKLNSFDEQRVVLDLKEKYFNYLSNYLTNNIGGEALVAPSSLGVSDPTLLELVAQYNDLQMKRNEIGERNPNYERYTKQMMKIRETLFEVLKNVKAVYRLERQSFDEQVARVNGEIDALPSKEHQMINIERKYKINDNYYTFLLQKRSEAQIRKASNTPDNSILQKARVSSMVNGDVKRKNYIFFCLLGLLLPSLFIVLKEVFNGTIRISSDLEKITRYPVIGNIRHTNNAHPVLSIRSPKSLFAESFRVVRTRIEIIVQRQKQLCILISSAESGDGKSYFSANLAGIYGMTGRRTLLIDMDIRKPSVSKLFGKENQKGLVNYLINEVSLEDAIYTQGDYGFDILFVGVVPPNPGEMMRSDKLKSMIQQLKEKYDYVIIDSSPLGLVADAYALVGMTDINLMVVRSDKTNKNFFKNFIHQIKADAVPNVYLVLNDIDDKKLAGYGYGYGYGRSYGYGYGYGYGYHKGSSKNEYYTTSDFEEEVNR